MLNNVILVGRLTKEADLKYTSKGHGVATFSLAVNRSFTNQGERREEVDFINCVIWRKPAETLASYAKKGTLLGITGRLQARSYENQTSQRIYVTEVIVEKFRFLEPRSVNEQRGKKNHSNPKHKKDLQLGHRNILVEVDSEASATDDLPF